MTLKKNEIKKEHRHRPLKKKLNKTVKSIFLINQTFFLQEKLTLNVLPLQLVVHVGVSSAIREIQIETCANRTGYKRADIEDTCPANGQVCCGQADIIQTSLCARTICDRLNQDASLKAAVSNDPGR